MVLFRQCVTQGVLLEEDNSYIEHLGRMEFDLCLFLIYNIVYMSIEFKRVF